MQRVFSTYTYSSPSLHFLDLIWPYHTLQFLLRVIHSDPYKRHLKSSTMFRTNANSNMKKINCIKIETHSCNILQHLNTRLYSKASWWVSVHNIVHYIVGACWCATLSNTDMVWEGLSIMHAHLVQEGHPRLPSTWHGHSRGWLLKRFKHWLPSSIFKHLQTCILWF